ncbi:membrane-bound alkaline phosphatase-like [Agrilus planipennis]|uniref:alkaline phosphatase n=1 Tax=Agrilus planipennis TaxID=224129 RepID=A0A1W4WTI4_AGRPL|nr:membrane-bound alkaline phosphatase-like [Agrilus planipennis]
MKNGTLYIFLLKGTYAYTADRNWENDVEVKRSGCNPNITRDIAYQLINGETGRNFNVILGGGRKMFLPRGQFDEQGQEGSRFDGLNLIEKWKQFKSKTGKSEYVWNRNQLVKLGEVQNLLGLFTDSHMSFDLDRDPNVEPSLTEMTQAAISVLSKNDNGYFLFVEGGMIDQAHHLTYAQKALGDTLAFADAVQRAVDITGRDDTLIVVTADHGHTLTFNGYAGRGSDIFGLAGLGEDGLPYSVLTYSNGPGYAYDKSGKRRDLREDHMGKKDYKFPVQIPLSRETHDGEDVPIYALGPWAHLFSGAYEQNVIPHVIAYASCVGDGITACEQDMRRKRRKRSYKFARPHRKN